MPADNPMTETTVSVPVPDPTKLTTDAVEALRNQLTENIEKDLAIRDERMAAMDRATELRLGGIQAIPGMIDEKVNHLGMVINARLQAMDGRLDMFDGLRLELKADSKTSIDAALLAQKEQATLQDQANQKAIDKQNDQNEKAMDKLTELFRAEMAALRTEIVGLRTELAGVDTRVTRNENIRTGVQEERTEHRSATSASQSTVQWVMGLILAALVIGAAIFAANQDPAPQEPTIIEVPVPEGA